jgi:glutaredoxin
LNFNTGLHDGQPKNKCGRLEKCGRNTSEIMKIELLGKPGCHLCDEAKTVVESVCAQLHLPWVHMNLEDQPELYAQYRDEIPVLLVDGRKLFKYRMDEKSLSKVLLRKIAEQSG